MSTAIPQRRKPFTVVAIASACVAYVLLFHMLTAFGWVSSQQETESGPFAYFAYACYISALILISLNFTKFLSAVRSSPLFLSILVLAHLSVYWSIDTGTTLKFLLRLDFLIIMAAAISSYWTLAESIAAFRRVGVLLIVGSLVLVVVHSTAVYDEYGQLRGLFAHKNTLGAFAGNLGGVLLADYYFGTGKLQRFAEVALCIVAIYLSHSATGLLILVLTSAIVIFCWIGSRMPPNQRIILLGIAVLFVFLALIVMVTMPELVMSSLDRSTTLTGRTRVWAVSEALISKHPILGYGYHVIGSDNPVGRALLAFGPPFTHPHDTWLATSLQIGLLGAAMQFAFYCDLTVAGFKIWWKNARRIEGPLVLIFVTGLWLRSIPESDFLLIPSFEFVMALILAWNVRRLGSAGTMPTRSPVATSPHRTPSQASGN